LHRIVACLDARNVASARLAERLGMRREAHFVSNEMFKGEWTDEVIYAMLAEDWAVRTS
jgi:RimJ/RimL family protein N-acetyltransferase